MAGGKNKEEENGMEGASEAQEGAESEGERQENTAAAADGSSKAGQDTGEMAWLWIQPSLVAEGRHHEQQMHQEEASHATGSAQDNRFAAAKTQEKGWSALPAEGVWRDEDAGGRKRSDSNNRRQGPGCPPPWTLHCKT